MKKSSKKRKVGLKIKVKRGWKDTKETAGEVWSKIKKEVGEGYEVGKKKAKKGYKKVKRKLGFKTQKRK